MNPPPPYENAAEVLDRARALFGLADHELMQALLPAIRDRASDLGTDDYYRRAEIMASLASAGANVAQAMMVQEDEQLAEQLAEQLGRGTDGS